MLLLSLLLPGPLRKAARSIPGWLSPHAYALDLANLEDPQWLDLLPASNQLQKLMLGESLRNPPAVNKAQFDAVSVVFHRSVHMRAMQIFTAEQ
ncbi:MAG: hypothetical protein ACI87W_000990 [Halieaceae bacterium]